MGLFPCRYKKCKGVVHKGKCPVASARGKKGGRNGNGESKQRLGAENGRFYKPMRECCETREYQPHDLKCDKSRITMRKVREIINIQPKTIVPTWHKDAILIEPIKFMMRGITGYCECGVSMPATLAKRVHPQDIQANPMRIICDACVA